VVGASAHRVALDNVEVLEVDQWLALLIIGDLDPYTQPVTGPELLPTRSAKSRFAAPKRNLAIFTAPIFVRGSTSLLISR